MQNAATTLHSIEEKIDTIGGYPMTALHDRLHNVEVMEHALQRNFAEVLQPKVLHPAQRVRKMRRLSRCIESEAANLRHEVDFLTMGSQSSIIAVADLAGEVLERVIKMLKQTVHTIATLNRSNHHN